MPVHSLKNPILIKVKDGIEAKLPEELKQPVGLIVAAGQRVLYSPTTHPAVVKVYEQLKTQNFNPDAIATGMVNLIGMVNKAAQGKVPVDGMFPAMTILLCYVLDDLAQMYGYQVNPATLKAITNTMLQKFKQSAQAGAQSGAPNPASPQPGGLAQAGAPPMPPQGAM